MSTDQDLLNIDWLILQLQTQFQKNPTLFEILQCLMTLEVDHVPALPICFSA